MKKVSPALEKAATILKLSSSTSSTFRKRQSLPSTLPIPLDTDSFTTTSSASTPSSPSLKSSRSVSPSPLSWTSSEIPTHLSPTSLTPSSATTDPWVSSSLPLTPSFPGDPIFVSTQLTEKVPLPTKSSSTPLGPECQPAPSPFMVPITLHASMGTIDQEEMEEMYEEEPFEAIDEVEEEEILEEEYKVEEEVEMVEEEYNEEKLEEEDQEERSILQDSEEDAMYVTRKAAECKLEKENHKDRRYSSPTEEVEALVVDPLLKMENETKGNINFKDTSHVDLSTAKKEADAIWADMVGSSFPSTLNSIPSSADMLSPPVSTSVSTQNEDAVLRQVLYCQTKVLKYLLQMTKTPPIVPKYRYTSSMKPASLSSPRFQP